MTSGSNAVFAELVRAQLLPTEGVTRIMQARRFTVLYSSGNLSDSVYFLDTGLVKIVKRGLDGKEVLLTLVRPGEIFGEDAMLLGGQRQSTAEVLQEGCISIIPKELFAKFCDDHPESWRMLAVLLSRREQDLEQKVELLLMRDVEQRILLYLAELADVVGVAETNGSGRSVQLSQGEIASLVGATRETTSSTLNALARRGLVTLGRRKMIIADANALRLVAEAPRVRRVATVVAVC